MDERDELLAALEASRAEVERLRAVLEEIAGGPVQSALCTSPTRKMEHLSTMCPHCRARAALQNEQFRGGAVAASSPARADSLEIAKDGCAAYLGRKERDDGE